MRLGFFTLMFLIFLVLKLTGAIAWSWLWVTAPLWGGFVFTLGLIVFAVIVSVLAS